MMSRIKALYCIALEAFLRCCVVHRAVFSQQIVKLLMKLGLGHQNTLENRRLAIDMAAQLVLWEKQTLDSPSKGLASKRSRKEADLQV